MTFIWQLFQERRYFQGEAIAAYQHVAMLKLHYKIARALEQSLAAPERSYCFDFECLGSRPWRGGFILLAASK